MDSGIWQDHILHSPGGPIAWYECGAGAPAIFLHGGPGDDHRYLRLLAAPLSQHARCILYDQRGSGRSTVAEADSATINVPNLLFDLEALRKHLGQERLTLIGHSWGALLALIYAAFYPQRVERAALIGLGPLNEEMSAVARANLIKPLGLLEREALNTLRELDTSALEEGDLRTHREITIEIVTQLYAKSWFYYPQAAQTFAEMYRAQYSPKPLVHRYLNQSAREVGLWERLPDVVAPLLVMYGYQDFEPISQALLLKSMLPQVRLAMINECGHLPWLDQPAACFAALAAFLQPEEARHD